ncbi:MAG: NUDIX hydrolase [Rhodospirillales bacterium]|nr:NUDIX hydrolase [Rhodospirillales bacterium]
MNRANLLGNLETFQAYDALEEADRRRIVAFIESEPECFHRTLLKGHVTGSAVLLSACGTELLLNYHKFLDKWLNFGGHADGEEDVFQVAARELEEESGIRGAHPLRNNGIFDLGVHPIPDNPHKGEPAHTHYDIAYLFQAPEAVTFVISNESLDMKWVTFDEARQMPIDARMRRMLQKIAALNAMASDSGCCLQ